MNTFPIPDYVIDELKKIKPNSFIFAKMNGKFHGVVLEITKTPDCENQVVSAFPIGLRTFRKMNTVSGGTVPQ